MHCKSVGRKKLPFSTVGRSPEKFENHCGREYQTNDAHLLYLFELPSGIFWCSNGTDPVNQMFQYDNNNEIACSLKFKF
ncbi:hypothetical protein T11_12932 [Trichinella zimbabwensis]|uniref:Uncharacterized protein n=1 Tax=Trichinella zimbabwensis TaxID=268475 RepID=A0A0V1I340_9BILA|nr:hypothetical protein T11_12932 [Trichinella zimbabwensis]